MRWSTHKRRKIKYLIDLIMLKIWHFRFSFLVVNFLASRSTENEKCHFGVSLPRWTIIVRYFRQEIFKTDTIGCREFGILFCFGFLLLVRRTLSSGVWVVFLFAVGRQYILVKSIWYLLPWINPDFFWHPKKLARHLLTIVIF